MAAAVGAARRGRLLRAMGIAPWVRRSAPVPASASLPRVEQVEAIPAACVVVLPQETDARAMDLLGRALLGAGVALARAARVRVAGERLVGDLPRAPAYLVFGQAQARALGRELPAAQAEAVQIVRVDEPAALLHGAAAKRRLWTALRRLRHPPPAGN